MAKKPKKPSAGAGAARQRAAAAQSRQRSRADFGLAALREITSSNAFTMKDEARNTGHRSSLWKGTTRLRTMPVGFVSAGFIEPLKEEDAENKSSKGSSDADIPIVHDAVQQSLSALATEEEDLQADLPEAPLDLDSSASSFPDQVATAVAQPTPAPAAVANPDTTADEAVKSEAIGFFIDLTGDKTLAANISRSPPRVAEPQSSADESDSSTEVVLFKGRNNLNRFTGRVEHARAKPGITLDTIRLEVKAVAADTAEDSRRRKSLDAVPSRDRSKRPAKHTHQAQFDDEEEAIIADYIANMAADSDDMDEVTPQRPFLSADIGADDGGFGDDTSQSSMSSDDSAASKDEVGDAAFDRDTPIDLDSDEDGMASPTMDDETLARLLAKQEELGMGSDELLLSSGAFDGRLSADYRYSSQKSRRSKGAPRASGRAFASASAVADAFDDLDLMDWQRPSLQNQRKRGRRGEPPVFGLSDSDMEQTLQAAWQKDRESKKSRKLRREELRAQGLLGKHANPDDPRLRYPTGMTLEDIKVEMRSFLEGSEPRLELPPMDKSARATLHELARKFKVKSQSTGSGLQRRPTLIRTKYTASYTEERLEMAVSGLGRKHFPRLGLKGKGKAPRKTGGGAGRSAVTYQEGEIVGASAPELGQENKGRTMLEKMGWSSGMGLGSLDNKGILQPVAHVVKRSKAGLG